MTEDDTFRKLRKPSLHDMKQLIFAIDDNKWVAMGDDGVDEFMVSWCWTWGEYVREIQKFNSRNRDDRR